MKKALHYICTIEKFKQAILNSSIQLDVLAVYDDGSVISTKLAGYITSTRLHESGQSGYSYICTQSTCDKTLTIHII